MAKPKVLLYTINSGTLNYASAGKKVKMKEQTPEEVETGQEEHTTLLQQRSDPPTRSQQYSRT